MFGHNLIQIRQKPLRMERSLRQINQVRGIGFSSLRQRRCRRQPANAAPNHFKNRHRLGQRANIHAQIARRLRHVPCRAGKSRAAVGHGNIVVYGFGHADHLHRKSGIAAVLAHQRRSSHSAVSAHENHEADIAPAQVLDHAVVVVFCGLVAGRTQRCARAIAQQFEFAGCHLSKLDNVILHQPSHAVAGAKHAAHSGLTASL